VLKVYYSVPTKSSFNKKSLNNLYLLKNSRLQPGTSYISEDGNGNFYRGAENLLTKFALFNPHAFFILNGREISSEYVTPFASPKWTPTDKPDGAWYSDSTLSELIAAHITAGDGVVPIREFLAEFSGMSGTKVRAKALEALGLTGKTLNDLVIDGKMNQSKVSLIQAAMVVFSKRVKPDRLGVIGQDHFLRGNECSKYKCIKGEGDKDGKLPFVVEVSVGVFPDFDERTVWVGLNFSPIEGVPFEIIYAALDKAMVGENDPVAVLIHLTTPRVNFTDRAKRHAVLPDEVEEAIHAAIVSAASEWATKVKHKNRGEKVSQRELREMYRPKVKPVTVKDAAYRVMTQAYLKASDNGALPANARQIMYAARPLIIELVGKPDIWTTSARFTQGLLPDFISENPELTKDWDVVFDDRGHMHEPHTGRSLGIGTLAVRSYINGWHKPVVDKSLFIKLDRSTQTKGPSGRFNGVLFLEKEGFNPLLERAGIAERFDIGIMSTKGHSTTAARLLVESLSNEGIPIFVAHDFDKSGYGILQGLRESNRRWKWKTAPKVIDFGLNLADAMEMGLESEDVGFKDDKDPRILMREYGLPEDEVNFLCSHGRPGDWVGKRIELNAIPSGQFITWLEGKLIGAGVQKVIPNESVLNDAFTRFVQIGRAEKEMSKILAHLPEVSHTGNILKSVRDLLANNPLMPWDEAVAQLAGDAV